MPATTPRLLLILTEWPPAVGGMQTHARHLAAHFARQACAVEVLSHRVTDPALAAAAQAFDAGCGLPVRRVLSRLGFWHNLALIRQRIRAFQPDAVYASTVFYGLLQPLAGVPVVCRSVGNDVLRPWLGYPYPWGSRLLGAPAAQRALSWWLEHGRHPPWVDRLFREGRERLMRRAAAAHHGILANSHYTAGLLRDIGVDEGRIEVVAGGVDSAAFAAAPGARAAARAQLGLPAVAPVLLTVCRLVEKKGVEVLLDAVARLAPAVPGLRLLVVGDGGRRRAYEACAARLGLGAVVRFEGRVPHEHIARYYWAADVFALASYESRHAGGAVRDVETMGRVICEANAAGLPVVATASGGTPSVLRDGHNGLLVPPADAAALAAAIGTLLQAPARAQALARHGLLRARHEFDWSAVMARHEEAVDRSLGRAGRRPR
ncbi:glycosyltransferase family 4 protein [Aquabacterium sp.]|uniref:glycosyltransferase family 4 protein n=1 Tax=Aquabacterium sp. TaxID=1872578 RepID=UPI003784CBB4